MLEQNLSQSFAESEKQDIINNDGQPSLPSLNLLLKNTFSLIKSGFWRYVWINFLTIILIPLIVVAINSGILFFIHPSSTFSFVFGIVSITILAFFMVWRYPLMINLTDSLAKGEKKILFKKSLGYVLGLVVFSIIFGMILNVGFLLLIIPGIIWFVKYFFTTYIYCLEEKKIFSAFGLASQYTKGFMFALLARFLFFVVIYFVTYLVLLLIGAFIMPIAGVSVFGLIGNLSSGNINYLITLIPFAIIFAFIYFILFTIVEMLQIVYFYNVFRGLRDIKQKAWSENRQVTDGYSLGKKILVLAPFILIVVLIIFLLVSGSSKFNKSASIDQNLLNESDLLKQTEPNNDQIQLEEVLNLNTDVIDEEGIQFENENLNLDSDGDGLTDIEEEKWRTDPNYSDSDSDGYLDGEEVQNGYDPLGPGRIVTEEL